MLRKAAISFVDDFIEEYAWLGRLANEHKFNLIVLQGVLKFLKKAPNLRKEKMPISVGIIIENEFVKLNNSAINSKPFSISETANFCNLKDIVNGRTLCYLIDHKGIATIKEIPQQLVKQTSRETLQTISLTFQTVAICTEGSNAMVYSSGNLAQSRRNGQWIEPCFMEFEQLSKEGFALNVLSRILSVCCKLSEKNIGTTFIINAEEEIRFCHAMNRECTFDKEPLSSIPDDRLMDFANIDGAIILSAGGDVLRIGQKLDAPDTGNYEVGSGRGTRHNSASKYSKATKSIAFVVSDDGPISLYYNGKLVGHCYETLFG
jgi:DNA integrity scanning protein DisA with diadenylate cyclase activity